MIKVIAFDFVGVFVKENDFPLDPLEQLLESKFGVINNDRDFVDWAVTETMLSHEIIRLKIQHIIDNIYDVREPDIFTKIPKLIFSTATNHLSYLDKWFTTLPIAKHFNYFVNSALVNAEKPDLKFYQILADTVNEPPKDILFIDDNENNCIGAEKFGLTTIHLQRGEVLSKKILEILIH